MNIWRKLINKIYRTADMDNRDDRNKTSDKMEQHCDNKEKLKVDEKQKGVSMVSCTLLNLRYIESGK
jgi:hypothetical protein